MKRLKEHGLTIENIISMPDQKLYEMIKEATYSEKKVKTIKNISRILVEQYDGKVPSDIN